MDKRITVETDLKNRLNDLHDCIVVSKYKNYEDEGNGLAFESITLVNANGQTLANGHYDIAMYIGNYVLKQACTDNLSGAFEKLRNGFYE